MHTSKSTASNLFMISLLSTTIVISLIVPFTFRHEDAIPDFEAVLKLDHQMAVAHVNLGLIYMLKMDNHHR